MPTDLKKLIRKLSLFCLPFVLFGLIISFIDPYNYFTTSGPFTDEAKESISLPLNYAMWKMVEYRRQPMANILLGDSRMMLVKSEAIQAEFGLEYFNFAYGGGSLREAVKTFWFATEHTKLESVCFGINLDNYSSYEAKDRVSEVNACLANPFLYLVNFNVLKASAKLVSAGLTGKPAHIGKPKVTPEQFWKSQIEVSAREKYTNYDYPQAYHEDLQKVRDYCRANGIELSFLVFPSHQDLQHQVAVFNLEAAHDRMLADLADLGRVYSFELPNEITKNRDNYTDPYHFKLNILEIIVKSVWGDDRRFVEILGK